MEKSSKKLRGVVLTWTILTTTFFWTSTMRVIYKPEISDWSIFGLGGQGFKGDFWLLPLIVVLSLFMFYLEGRGKHRLVFHIFLISWHLLISSVIIYGSFQPDARISFGTWGVELDFYWLIPPFLLGLILAIAMVIDEQKSKRLIPEYNWNQINLKTLYIALAIIPFSLLLFSIGTGFNWLVKIAVASTIFQWILLAESLGRPEAKRTK